MDGSGLNKSLTYKVWWWSWAFLQWGYNGLRLSHDTTRLGDESAI